VKDENETGASESDLRDYYPVLTVTENERAQMVKDGASEEAIAELEKHVNLLIRSDAYSEVSAFGALDEDGEVKSDQMWFLRTHEQTRGDPMSTVEGILERIEDQIPRLSKTSMLERNQTIRRKNNFYLHLGNTRSVSDIYTRYVAQMDWAAVQKLKAIIREVIATDSWEMNPNFRPDYGPMVSDYNGSKYHEGQATGLSEEES